MGEIVRMQGEFDDLYYRISAARLTLKSAVYLQAGDQVYSSKSLLVIIVADNPLPYESVDPREEYQRTSEVFVLELETKKGEKIALRPVVSTSVTKTAVSNKQPIPMELTGTEVKELGLPETYHSMLRVTPAAFEVQCRRYAERGKS